MKRFLLWLLLLTISLNSFGAVIVQDRSGVINNYLTKMQLSGTGATFTNVAVGNLTPSASVLNNATWSSGVTLFGKPTIEFDGTNDAVIVGSKGDYNFVHEETDSYTIQMWFYDDGAGGIIVTTGPAYNSGAGFIGAAIALYGGQKIEWTIRNNSGRTIDLLPATTYTQVVWNHLAITFDKVTTLYTVYLNGISISSGVKTGAIYNGDTLYATRLGLDQDESQDFDGKLAGFQIIKGRVLYNRNFTPPKRGS